MSNNWRSKSWKNCHNWPIIGSTRQELVYWNQLLKKMITCSTTRLSTTPRQLFSLSFLDPLSSLSWSLEQATFSHILTFYIVWYALCGIEMAFKILYRCRMHTFCECGSFARLTTLRKIYISSFKGTQWSPKRKLETAITVCRTMTLTWHSR